MNPLIALATLTGPPETKPSMVPVHLEARELPELTRMYSPAYADGAGHLHGRGPEWMRDLFDGVHGHPVAEASLVTVAPNGRLTAPIITTVAVGIDSSNAAAMALYLSRDFRCLTGDGIGDND